MTTTVTATVTAPPLVSSFAAEIAVQTELSRRQLADGIARGDEAAVESAHVRLAELADLHLHHSPDEPGAAVPDGR
ncbi:hypothetical protein AB2L27_06225 [Kineococcus sp. LSe6-4]|uniref:CopG family transcriptional regulator n=1 Tax=Kineococcus halophytocola TaxID=3234027 RepID=A0ABV4H0I8_9ACTN